MSTTSSHQSRPVYNNAQRCSQKCNRGCATWGKGTNRKWGTEPKKDRSNASEQWSTAQRRPQEMETEWTEPCRTGGRRRVRSCGLFARVVHSNWSPRVYFDLTSADMKMERCRHTTQLNIPQTFFLCNSLQRCVDGILALRCSR